MTFLGTVVGFFLAWILVTWTLSALACAASLRAPSPPATATALLGPPALSAFLIAWLAVSSVAGPDHCPEHLHHPHLCLMHGAAWMERPIASAAAAGIAALFSVTLAFRTHSAVRATMLVTRLRRLATPIDGAWRVASDRVFCFTAGIRTPLVFVSSAAWDSLSPDARRAMLAHERAHVRGCDPAWQLALSLAAGLGFPLLAERTLVSWRRANERLRDAAAAREVGAIHVAEALMQMAKATRHAYVSSFGPRAGELSERLEAVLGERPETPPRITRGVLAAAGVAWIVAVLGFEEPIHHLLESILGRL